MISLFLGLTVFNLLSLCATAVLGYAVMVRGPAIGPYHQLLGVLSTIACCAVHCIVFTYFIATAKWIQHAIEIKHLDPKLSHPTRSFKAHAFPAALIAMAIVFLTAVIGVITLSYGITPIWHQVLAITSLLVNAIVAIVEYRAIANNGRLIDEVLALANSQTNLTAAK